MWRPPGERVTCSAAGATAEPGGPEAVLTSAGGTGAALTLPEGAVGDRIGSMQVLLKMAIELSDAAPEPPLDEAAGGRARAPAEPPAPTGELSGGRSAPANPRCRRCGRPARR